MVPLISCIDIPHLHSSPAFSLYDCIELAALVRSFRESVCRGGVFNYHLVGLPLPSFFMIQANFSQADIGAVKGDSELMYSQIRLMVHQIMVQSAHWFKSGPERNRGFYLVNIVG